MGFRITIFLILLGFVAGCSDQNFSAGASANSTRRDPKCFKKSPELKDCKPPTVDKIDPPVQPPASVEHEAVFAVRNMSCAFCHAKIESNVISDFASKTGGESAAESLSQMTYMTKDSRSSSNGSTVGGIHSISGKFIVPSGQTSAYAGAVSNCKNASLGALFTGALTNVSLIDILNQCVSSYISWGGDSEKFVARKTVEINPVSSPDTITAIAAGESSKLEANGFVAIGSGTISGLSGSKASGFKTSGTLACEGAVVLIAPLMIKNTVIKTQNGCRIYSTRSIFVFGNATVEGPSQSANLQLMSAVFVGFDISSQDSTGRITHPLNQRQVFTIGSPSEVKAKIIADATLVGATTGGGGNTGYSKIAASAPVVYSRTSGNFSGVIIAEQFLGRIGSLSFTFDPVFKKGTTAPQIFPEIKTQLVTVSSD